MIADPSTRFIGYARAMRNRTSAVFVSSSLFSSSSSRSTSSGFTVTARLDVASTNPAQSLSCFRIDPATRTTQ
jgi:hypothetical protein